jgi:hypothetical protein
MGMITRRTPEERREDADEILIHVLSLFVHVLRVNGKTTPSGVQRNRVRQRKRVEA